jgi:hypothetical protein
VILMIRPDDWNFPVLLHVGGAMALMASVAVAGVALIQAWRVTDVGAASSLQRFGARTLLWAALPSFIVMRGAAEWALSREGLDNSNDTWIGVGFLIADIGGLLLLISIIIANIGVRRSRDGGVSALGKVSATLSVILIIAYLVAVWAMTTKPT